MSNKEKVLAAALLTFLNPQNGMGCVFTNEDAKKDAIVFLKKHYKYPFVEDWVNHWGKEDAEHGNQCFYWTGKFSETDAVLKRYKDLVSSVVPDTEKKESKPAEPASKAKDKAPPAGELPRYLPMEERSMLPAGGYVVPARDIWYPYNVPSFAYPTYPQPSYMNDPGYQRGIAEIEAARQRQLRQQQSMDATAHSSLKTSTEAAPGDLLDLTK